MKDVVHQATEQAAAGMDEPRIRGDVLCQQKRNEQVCPTRVAAQRKSNHVVQVDSGCAGTGA